MLNLDGEHCERTCNVGMFGMLAFSLEDQISVKYSLTEMLYK